MRWKSLGVNAALEFEPSHWKIAYKVRLWSPIQEWTAILENQTALHTNINRFYFIIPAGTQSFDKPDTKCFARLLLGHLCSRLPPVSIIYFPLSHVNRSQDAKEKSTDVLASPIASSSRERSEASELINRQLGCPPGSQCGHGPVCAPPFCGLPACVGTELCQNSTIAERQLPCPSGLNCGPGPVCTSATCDLPGCADAEVCQDDQYKKRSTEGALENRQLACPPGVHCGPGPECTPATCDLPGCADADVCQDDLYKKRTAATDIAHPVCDICIVGANGVPVCGCATSSGGSKRRDADRICPQFCIETDEGETLCGCAAEDYEQGNPPSA